MIDEERDDGKPKVHEVSTSDNIGVRLGEGLIMHGVGADSETIRVVDSRGWTATGDVEAGATSAASTTGIPSQNEDLTVETCAILIQRLNLDGATWGDPVQLDNRTGAGVDCEAQDTRDPRRRLRVQVIRAEVDPTSGGSSGVTRGPSCRQAPPTRPRSASGRRSKESDSTRSVRSSSR
jgi:hypothetical protein